MKELCPEVSEIMDAVTKIVNYIKTLPLKSRLLADLWKEMGLNINHSCFSVILVVCQEETWLVFRPYKEWRCFQKKKI
jgi:hypothetical protein